MAIVYKKLWKKLIDLDMNKKELSEKAGVSYYVIGKLYRGENVTTDVLAKICVALNCTMDDIMEIIPNEGIDGRQDQLEKRATNMSWIKGKHFSRSKNKTISLSLQIQIQKNEEDLPDKPDCV